MYNTHINNEQIKVCGGVTMIRLIVPNKQYLQSYKEACKEYADHHVSTYHFTDASDCDVLAKFDNYRNERNLKPDRVGADYYWLVDDEKALFIGEVTIRHKLTIEAFPAP